MQSKGLWAVFGALLLAAIVGVAGIIHIITTPLHPTAQPIIDYKNLSYRIDGHYVQLKDGYASVPAAPHSSSTIVTQYFGDEFSKDLNADGVSDTAFMVTQSGGGSGTFFYVVAAVSTATSSVGTDGFLLGDRIAPQGIYNGPGNSIIVAYADRRPTDPFSVQPSEGKSVTLTLDPATRSWLVLSGTATSTASSTVTASTSTSTATTSTATTSVNTFDLHAIPVGDGNVASGPRVGYVFACDTNFRQGGAAHTGNWIEGSTWDPSIKPTVQGNVLWPLATFTTYIEGTKRMLQGNGLPVNAATGIFPIATTDPAYQYDRNPNHVGIQTVSVLIPKDPSFAASASCLPMGPIGYALNGVAIFNALDDSGRDAGAHEIQDSCGGHPERDARYHYHTPSPCIPNAKVPNALVGYALDGYGIYSQYKADGTQYTDADLDACHGTTTPVLWNGTIQSIYHYVMTAEYPYTLGCYRGTPVSVQQRPSASPTTTATPSSGQTSGTPPPEATTACTNAVTGASCSFTTPKGTVTGTCRIPPGQTTLVCVP